MCSIKYQLRSVCVGGGGRGHSQGILWLSHFCLLEVFSQPTDYSWLLTSIKCTPDFQYTKDTWSKIATILLRLKLSNRFF